MQPNRATKSGDRSNATDLAKHEREARSRRLSCQLLFLSNVCGKRAIALIEIDCRANA
jgi:hypothetical protein